MNRAECLEEAGTLVRFSRATDYGDANENFSRIAALWSSIGIQRNGEQIAGSDVALMMILLKVARHAGNPKDDNWVDIAGYAALGAELDANEGQDG